MNTKLMLYFVAVVFITSLVSAEWIQPLECDKLLSKNEVSPSLEFEELAKICFYGSGYKEESVMVTLKSDKVTYEKQVMVSHGIVSSQASSGNFFSDVISGIYKLIVKLSGRNIEYANDITVTGFDDGETPDGGDSPNEDGQDEEPAQVPEFGTISLGLVVAGAGYYYLKRRSVSR